MKKVRVGIIGGGRISDLHAPAYKNIDTAELVAVCDANENTARRRAEEWTCRKWYTDYREIISDPEIDMVEVILPHKLHAPVTIAAAEAGKHVSVQKPMAMNIDECDAMVEAARKAGVKLRVFENFVFYPPYRKAIELMEAGEIGEPRTLRLHMGGSNIGGWHVPLSTWLWHLNHGECGGGNILWDDGFHKFSLAIELFGPVKTVSCWIDYAFGLIDAPGVVCWEHKNGRLGYIDLTMSPNLYIRSKYYSGDERVEITGDRGSIVITRCTGRLNDEPALIMYRDGVTTSFSNIRADWQDSFTDCSRDFIDALINDREPKLTGERGRDVTMFSMAAYQAAYYGKPTRPEEVEGTCLSNVP